MLLRCSESGRIEQQVKVVASPRNQIKSPPRQCVGGFLNAQNRWNARGNRKFAECQENQCFFLLCHRVLARPCHMDGT
jgi:hypothetical protein